MKDGYIILNRALEVGDKVLMLRVMRGQQFIILSRVFEKEAGGAGGSARIVSNLDTQAEPMKEGT